MRRLAGQRRYLGAARRQDAAQERSLVPRRPQRGGQLGAGDPLPPGAIVYPTGAKNGLWWEVADENDNVGWVLNTKLAPSN
jgi:hypothetical protein